MFGSNIWIVRIFTASLFKVIDLYRCNVHEIANTELKYALKINDWTDFVKLENKTTYNNKRWKRLLKEEVTQSPFITIC